MLIGRSFFRLRYKLTECLYVKMSSASPKGLTTLLALGGVNINHRWKCSGPILHEVEESNLMNSTAKLGHSREKSDSTSKDDFVTVLVDELRLPEDEASSFLERNVILSDDVEKFKYIVKSLREMGMNTGELMENLVLFFQRSDEVKSYVKFVTAALGIDNTGAIHFYFIRDVISIYIDQFLTSDMSLMKMNRVQFFQMQCNVSSETVCRWYKLYPFLLSIPSAKFLLMYETVTCDVNVTPKDILNDPQFFRYSLLFINRRIEMLKKSSIIEVRPWMLRAGLKALRKYEEFSSATYSYLWIDFMAEALKCDKETVNAMYERWPYLRHIKICRVKELCCLLEKNNLPINLIIHTPSILAHSPTKLQMRIEMLLDAGFTSEDVQAFHNILVQNTDRFLLYIKQKTKFRDNKPLT